MTTDEISGKPRVPVGELRDLADEWNERADGNEQFGYEYDGAAYRSAANELEELIQRYDQ